jgi:hypothetical protein
MIPRDCFGGTDVSDGNRMKRTHAVAGNFEGNDPNIEIVWNFFQPLEFFQL